jgi:hypothetical protein
MQLFARDRQAERKARRQGQQMESRRAQLELERALVRIGGRELAALYRKGEYRWPR